MKMDAMGFGRVITAMATPLNADGSLDLDGAAALAQHLVAHGTESIVVCGTTGESPTLTSSEKRSLFETVVRTVGGRAGVIAGTGTYSTAESIELSAMAEECGVDGLLLVTPYYSKPPQSGLYEHFATIAGAIELPIIVYDIPSRTARKIEHETLLRLAQIPNIIGVKDAAGDLAGTARLATDAPGLTIWSGDDILTLPMLAVGAVGVVSVASHLAGDKIAEMVHAHVKGDTSTATAINSELVPLIDALFCTTSPIPLKAGLAMMGLPAGPLRLPLVEATEEESQQVRAALVRLGLL